MSCLLAVTLIYAGSYTLGTVKSLHQTNFYETQKDENGVKEGSAHPDSESEMTAWYQN